MLPMPVWKSSYRLVFNEQGQATLEGWAIVDNTTTDDWMNVRLAVVSGRPVSFISNLYEPKFVQRQTVDLADAGSTNPVLYAGAIMDQMALASPAPPPPRAAAAKRMGGNGLQSGTVGAIGGFAGYAESMGTVAQSSVAVNTQARELGDLFEYRFAAPVTIKRGESAMLPFVQQKLDARKLLVYAESYGQNPMSAAELTNSTGKTLDGGPITVFDGNSYAGEALMETLKAADKRLISYAIDLGTRITTRFDSSRDAVREIHLNRGLLTTKYASEETKTFTIRNVDARTKTLIVEYPQRAGYKLLNVKPIETTAAAYRFEVKLAANGTEKFPVNEERIFDQTTGVSNLTPDALLAMVQNKTLPDSARRALQQIADAKRQLADTERQIGATQSEIGEVTSDEGRARQNIESLNRVSGQQEQVQKYARQLADQETRLASLRDQASQLKKQKTGFESNLNSMIEKLEF